MRENDPIIEPTTATPSLVASFEIHLWRYLNADGIPVCSLPAFAAEDDKLLQLYRNMVLVRAFDARAVALQRTGQLGTYASSLGQEAVGAALGDALAADDVFLPTYRETLALLLRGVAMHELLLYWGGDERGMAWPENREDFPLCVPIGSQVPHAVGVAQAFRYRQQSRVVICPIGDGGSSKGDFYEALNLAGAWRLPVVFVVVNNQWAISVPREVQTGAETLAQKAIAAGIDTEQVDGNDVIALRERLGVAIERARAGEGPRLIEALTYRLCDHTTADDASRYRSNEELDAQWQREPLLRLRRYLESIDAWDEQQETRWREECEQRVAAEVDIYLATEPMPAEAMFDHLYETLPVALYPQREEVARRSMSANSSPAKGDTHE